ncbi:sensor histidine kinase [Mucilaginibacter pocheonensis]|uniref:histidine kinase n=1 Tax=Mucilaginibacter pocheonensis TaxID=398050 RepID=A0ABU1TGC1_9SPHI|nr:7TM diverse intracellular signaling domain-containing protein [Mucilaginibacter pocheonensis]MDR6944451.1 signal transduction histidine kinase [Mucilaginibacter pocheonensis]
MQKTLLTAYLLFLSAMAWAYKPDTLVINDNQSYLLTNKYFKELEDPKGKLTINEVLDNNNFHSIDKQLPVLKYSKSTTWIKFILKNNSNEPSITVSTGASIIDDFDLYYTDSTGANVRHLNPDYIHNGLIARNITFINCPVLPGASAKIYLHIKSNASTVMPVKIYSAFAFLQSRYIENIILGVIAGIFIVMALYNFMLYFIVGDRSYLYYVGYIIFLGLSLVLERGYGGNLFTKDITILNNYVVPVVRVLLGFSILLFVSEFLQLKQNLNRWYKYYFLLYIFYALLLVAVVCGMVVTAYNLITIGTSIISVSLLIVGTYLYVNGFKPAKLFMLGWGIFSISILISMACTKGLIIYNSLTVNIVVYSSVLELILFSAALAEKINFYRKQKNELQNFGLIVAKENERLIMEQNILLENKVKERTNELIITNKNLSISIDHLMATQKQLIDNEKMASLGQLTAGVAHEINNPINFVSSNIAPLRLDFDELLTLLGMYEDVLNNPGQPLLLNNLNDYKQKINLDLVKDEITLLLNGIEDGANRTADIVSSLRTFSSTDELVLKTQDINKSILNNLLILRSTIPYYIEIKPIFDKLEPLNCYPGKINQLIINLINNSIYAIKAKEQHSDESIMITTKDHPNHISIEVTDTGTGMSDETRQRIFEPFFTTKGIGEGTGLGLSIVFGIIEKHRGSIEVISSPGKGATFIILLPKNLS